MSNLVNGNHVRRHVLRWARVAEISMLVAIVPLIVNALATFAPPPMVA